MTYDDERRWPPQSGAGDDGDATPEADDPAVTPAGGEFTSRVSFPSAQDLDAPPDAEVDAVGDEIEPEFDPEDADAGETDAEPEIAPGPAAQAAPAAPRATGEAPAIFVDSSALVALVDRDDASHAAAVDAYRNLLADGYKLFTTNHVMVEAFDLLSTGVGPEVARRFLRDCKLSIYHADEQDERRARRLILRQTGGRGLSLTDAISLVVMERLNVGDAFAVDPGFLADAR